MPWEKLSEKKYQAGFRPMLKKTYRLPSGEVTDFDVVADPQSVAVVAVTSEGLVLTVKQYRPGPECEVWDLVGGYMEAGETPEQAAARELKEETGYVGDLLSMGATWRGAYTTSRTHQFLAKNCHKVGEISQDPHECIELVPMSKEEFLDLLERGDLTDLGTGFKAAWKLGWLGEKA